MNIQTKLQEFSDNWKSFVDTLSTEELASKELMQLVVNHTSFVTNYLQKSILIAATQQYETQLKTFKPKAKPKPEIVKGV